MSQTLSVLMEIALWTTSETSNGCFLKVISNSFGFFYREEACRAPHMTTLEDS